MVMNNNSALAAARWYISQGFFPVPIPPGQKGPVMKNWPAFRCTEAEAEAAFSQRGNIGIILTDGLACIDLDHPMASSLAPEYLPPTQCIVGRPGNPTSHWFYRVEGPPLPNRMLRYTLDGVWHTVLDILSEGKQVVVGPSIHPSGDRYDPLQGEPGIATAPELLLAVEGLFGAVVGQLRASGLRVGEVASASASTSTSTKAPRVKASPDAKLRVGDDFNDRGDIREVLTRNGWTMVRAGDNEHWRRPGKTGSGISATLLHGRQFWNFSSSAPHLAANRLYDAFGLLAHLEHQGNFSAASDRLRGDGFGAKEAFAGEDFTSPPDYSWVGKSAAPLAASASASAPEPEEDASLVFPIACLRPPGLLSDIIDHNLLTASHPQPLLALAGALALMSTITGNRVRSFPGHVTHTNLFVLALAPTGAGKDHARNINRDLLLAAGGGEYVGSESIGSAAGIITALDKQPVLLMQLDEIADMLTTMRNATKSPHLYQIGPTLKAVKTSAGRVCKGPALKHEENLKELRFPHLVIYGTSIPDGFWESISSTQVFDGLLSRFLVFETGYVRVCKDAADAKPPESLVLAVSDWLHFGFPPPQGAFAAAVAKHQLSEPTFAAIQHTPEALERAIGHMDQINERQIEEAKTDSARAAIWSRTSENTNQLALLFACSRCGASGDGLEITLPDINLAVQLSNWLTRRMLTRVKSHVSETEHERQTKRVLRQVPKGGIFLRDLQRLCQWIKPRDFHDLLSSLVEMELIDIEAVKTGKKGKPPKFVRRVAF